jgi:DNA (cytosine-5)-methyltransferase 1
VHYYNEFDPFPAAWLRNLGKAGHIPDGTVDERSIVDVQAKDLNGVHQAHFFAGVGGWPLALKLAGWPERWPVWTGSCPCQPFSVAGAKKGTADKRHLWPDFFRLIRECRPSVVFGEQVASPAGRKWLSGIQADLEGVGYAVGRADVCAAGVGAPQIRQRLWWVASAAGWKPGDGEIQRGGEHGFGSQDDRFGGRPDRAVRAEEVQLLGLVGPAGERLNGSQDPAGPARGRCPEDASSPSRMGGSRGAGSGGNGRAVLAEETQSRGEGQEAWYIPDKPLASGFWAHFDAIPCRDGVYRRVEPGTFPLAHGVPARVGKLRAYGNAISPELAAEFIKAYLEIHKR